MKKLVVVPDPRLRKKSKPIKEINGQVKRLAQDMEKFLLQRKDKDAKSIGLAAVQLGTSIRMFAFIENPGAAEPRIQFIINPEITKKKKERFYREACLSIPGKVFLLKRYKLVKVKGLTLDGEERTFSGRETLAQVFQHEVNHLDGILIDTLGKEVKQ